MNHHFFQKVYEIVARVPAGKVVSYGQIAAYLGYPRSSRMVGWAMHSAPSGIPWQRVVLKSGKLPFDNSISIDSNQYDLLSREGVTFREDRTVNMEKHLWKINLPL